MSEILATAIVAFVIVGTISSFVAYVGVRKYVPKNIMFNVKSKFIIFIIIWNPCVPIFAKCAWTISINCITACLLCIIIARHAILPRSALIFLCSGMFLSVCLTIYCYYKIANALSGNDEFNNDIDY